MSTVYEIISNGKPDVVALHAVVENMRSRFEEIASRLDELNRTKYTMLNHVRYEIAIGLYLINTDNLIHVSDYVSLRDYAEKALGLKSVSVTMYLKVAKFLLCKDKPLNIFGNDDFTITQLYKMSQIALDDLRDYVEHKMIVPEMTGREIDAFVAEWKFKQQRKVNLHTLDSLRDDFDVHYEELRTAIANNDNEGAYRLLEAIGDDVAYIYNEAKSVTEM